MAGKGPVALVTGGNRGIGLEACRALARRGATVLLASRRKDEGLKAAKGLEGDVRPVVLDVTKAEDAEALAKSVAEEFGALDALVNNAGVYRDESKGALDVDEATIRETLETNLLGAWRLCRLLGPAMVERGSGRIVNMSSGLGQISRMGGGTPSYRVSKAALNALTLILADELKPVTVASVDPGWVRTDMGGPSAPRDPKTAGEEVAAAALDDRRSGVFLRHGDVVDW